MRYLSVIIFMLAAVIAYAGDRSSLSAGITEMPEIGGMHIAKASDAVPDTTALPEVKEEKKDLIQKIVGYFEESNKPKEDKKFDISFMGGPYYSSDTKFGVGLVAAGLYKTDYADSLLMPSDVSLYLKATSSMHFELGVRGNHIFPGDRMRMNYDVNFASIKSKFWGIGYDMNVNDNNESVYKYLKSQAHVKLLWRLADNFYVGPMLTFDYVNGRDFELPFLWNGEDDRTFNFGVGFTVQYDSRDFISNAYKGVCLKLDQRFNPHFMLNRYAFSLTSFDISWYQRVWKGCTLAAQFTSRFTYGNTPWGLLSTLGGSDNMRGYFEGRYRDKCEMDVCLELRQHVWRRNGVVAWIGAGTVFPRLKDIEWRKILPNYGIGYRWEFKKRVNVRVDLGFGKHQRGFIFSINEAF